MSNNKSVLYEDSTYKVMRMQNLRGKNRHNTVISVVAVDKSTGKQISLLELPEEVQALVNQAETLR